MKIKLFNSLHHRLEIFKTTQKTVGLYTCGPTVYNYAHIGNLRTYVFEDVLKRILITNNYRVKHVMNITDVGHLTDDADTGEDKMEKGAHREGKSAREIAHFYTTAFRQDLQDLNIIPPNIWCAATEHINEQIKLIKKIERNGFAYRTHDGLYFDTSKLSTYGQIANRKKQKIRAGIRVDLGDKKNPTDFALWKFSPTGIKRQMEWPSPWGVGFPGWHIECSAMSVKYLGQPFDIHCGGVDHIPVHHSNEIAQNVAATGKKLANYWLHGEFLIVGQEKMAKSGENFLTLTTIKNKNIHPLAYRYWLLQTHYRKQLNFSWEALQSAQNGYQKLCRRAQELRSTRPTPTILTQKYYTRFQKYLNADLGTPQALALTWQILENTKIKPAEKWWLLKKFDTVLGLNLATNADATTAENVMKLVTAREQMRRLKNWDQSDELRRQIELLGYQVEDTPQGTKIWHSHPSNKNLN